MATYVERVDGHTDRWDEGSEPFVMFGEGILRVDIAGEAVGYYAAGQWVTFYDEANRPLRVA